MAPGEPKYIPVMLSRVSAASADHAVVRRYRDSIAQRVRQFETGKPLAIRFRKNIHRIVPTLFSALPRHGTRKIRTASEQQCSATNTHERSRETDLIRNGRQLPPF